MITVTITIDDPNGIDTNLMFPSASPYQAVSSSAGGGTSGSLAWRRSPDLSTYQLDVTGLNIQSEAFIDVEGYISSMSFTRTPAGGAATQLMHVGFALDGAWATVGGVFINSLASLTPDVLMGRVAQLTPATLVIIGNAGADTLRGSFLDDTLRGGLGADGLFGGLGNDTASYELSPAGVTINLATGAANGGEAAGDVLSSIENVTGSDQGDSLTGNGAANVLRGLGGNDVLNGSGGADTLDGGAGNDHYMMGAENDAVTDSSGLDTIFTTVARNLNSYASVDNLLLQGGGNINGTGNALFNGILGNSGNNVLAGQGGNDALDGRGGNDFLYGQAGQDSLVGGTGNDTFVFQAAAHSPAGPTCDHISDFDDLGDDRIDLAGVFAGTLAYIGTNAFTAANQVRSQVVGANIVVAVNLDADTPPEMQILLLGTTLAQMGIDDFLL